MYRNIFEKWTQKIWIWILKNHLNSNRFNPQNQPQFNNILPWRIRSTTWWVLNWVIQSFYKTRSFQKQILIPGLAIQKEIHLEPKIAHLFMKIERIQLKNYKILCSRYSRDEIHLESWKNRKRVGSLRIFRPPQEQVRVEEWPFLKTKMITRYDEFISLKI